MPGCRSVMTCLASFCVVAAGHAAELTDAQTKQHQAAEAVKLLATLAASKSDAAQRKQAVDQLLELGEEGPRRLASWCAQQTEPRRSAYLARFERAVSAVVADHMKANGGARKVEAEVETLRKRSLEVSREKGLTKEAIKETCDPAVARLSELLGVKPEDAFARQEGLQAMRDELLDLLRIHESAYARIPADKRRGVPVPAAPDVFGRDLAVREANACLFAIPMKKSDMDVLRANLAIAAKLDPEEAAGTAELNRLRILLGIGALAIDTKLCDAGRGHSKDMKEKGFFAHESPVPGKETPWARAKLAGTNANAENIYAGSVRGTDAIRGWWYSPGHHANMMAEHKRTGLGRIDGHWTQMFGG